MQRRPCLALVLLASSLAAQVTTAPAAAAPATTAPATSPVVEITAIGPAGWRQRFSPTNLGSLLESAGGHALWEPLAAQLDGMARGLLGGDEQVFALARQRLLDYGGQVQLLVWSERPDGQDLAVDAGLVIGGDGRTDLAALARDLTAVLPAVAGSAWQTEKVGDAEQQVLVSGKDRLAAPVQDGDRLLLPYSQRDLAAVLQRLRARPAPEKPRPDAPALALHVDVPGLLRLSPGQSEERRITTALGFGSMQSLDVQLRTAGPCVAIDAQLQFDAGDRGLLGWLFPAANGLSSLLAVVPPKAPTWKIGHLDFVQGYNAIERAAAAFEEKDAAELRKAAVQELGLDPVTDLLAQLATDALLIGNVDRMLEDETGGFLLALALRDEAKFKQSLAAIVKQGKGFVSREATDDHDGVAIERYGGMFTGDLQVAVGRGLFVLARGPDAETLVGQVLDAAKAAAGKPGDGKLPAAFADLQRHAPPGLNGAACASAVAGLQLLSFLPELVGEAVPGVGRLERLDKETIEHCVELLAAHHLDRVRTLTGFAERQWRWRLFW